VPQQNEAGTAFLEQFRRELQSLPNRRLNPDEAAACFQRFQELFGAHLAEVEWQFLYAVLLSSPNAEAARQDLLMKSGCTQTEPREELLIFDGRFVHEEDDTAQISLRDPKGRIMDASVPLNRMQMAGIALGRPFKCSVIRSGDATRVLYEALPRQPLSDENWQQLKEQINTELGEDNPADDY
jgi:hypothetical protein